MAEPVLEVHAAIGKVMAALGKEGLAKTHKNTQQGFMFRGIDDVYNSLSQHLVAAGLVILPSYADRTVVEYESKNGSRVCNVVVRGMFKVVAIKDGSYVTVETIGEAMDNGDKATSKAMSVAFKYMAMQLFCIPVAGDNDADATTHEVKARASKRATTPPFGTMEEAIAIGLAVKTTDGFRVWADQARAMTGLNEKQRLELRAMYDSIDARLKPTHEGQ